MSLECRELEQSMRSRENETSNCYDPRSVERDKRQLTPLGRLTSSQQFGVSVRNTTIECSQGPRLIQLVNAHDHGGRAENDTDVPSHASRPIVDAHMAQCTVSGQDSVPRIQDLDVTNIVRISPQPEEMTELVSVTNAAGNISNFTYFQPHDSNGEPPMASHSYSQDMEGQVPQDCGALQSMTSHLPMIDTTRYSQSMYGQILQNSQVQQSMTLIDTTRYSRRMDLMDSGIYSHNIHPQSTNTPIHPQYIQEVDGSYN
ncbi:hypothetical protein EMCG_05520 [[Emmonsia] crescens]|uniref:Uncharacterized protein n=1 Tax=[Emmonsia] crescens TaxID=73230 RepID=A0A0G2HPM5_9EURO|nr:hypothetical protein EMCG_05520 [Emmonsia crescens UAMH 3008]